MTLRIIMNLLVLMIMSAVVEASITTYAASSVDSTYGIKGKVLPNKSDDACVSSKDRVTMLLTGDRSTQNSPRVCPNDIETTATTSATDSYNNSNNNNTNATSSLLNDSSLNLTIYASLPGYVPNLASILSWAVIGYLTDSSTGEYQIRSISDTNKNLTLQQLDTSEIYTARLDHLRTYPTEIRRNTTFKWWQYEFIFACYWGNGQHGSFNGRNNVEGTPILDKEFLKYKIYKDLQSYMEQGIESLSTNAFMVASNGTLALSLEDPRYSLDPFGRNETDVPPNVLPNALDSIIIEPQWGWRQNVGLFLCVSTISVTLALTYMASDRKKRRTRKEIWGNLGTEEGVDALLETAWKVQGDRMQVYNKGRWGYRDDDSIFMGGFQHGDAANTTGSVVDPQPETEEFLPTPNSY